jgi:excisionase family DNA binding protein
MSALPSPLTVHEVANLLGVSDGVVRDLLKKKRIRAGKVGGQWRIRREDLAEYIIETFEED